MNKVPNLGRCDSRVSYGTKFGFQVWPKKDDDDDVVNDDDDGDGNVDDDNQHKNDQSQVPLSPSFTSLDVDDDNDYRCNHADLTDDSRRGANNNCYGDSAFDNQL